MTTSDSQHSDHTITKAKINAETAKMGWDELVRYFAKGIVIRVEPGIDLVDVAMAMGEDNAQWLAPLTEHGLVRRATDDDARAWTDQSPEFWAVVVAPWLVVQPIETSTLV